MENVANLEVHFAAGRGSQKLGFVSGKITESSPSCTALIPTIDIEYLDDLDFEKQPHIDSECYHRANLPVADGGWEKGIRGPGPTPIRTKYGWLVLYHGTTKDCGYKMGAMLWT